MSRVHISNGGASAGLEFGIMGSMQVITCTVVHRHCCWYAMQQSEKH